MDKFYKQFFNGDEYPPDKKDRPESSYPEDKKDRPESAYPPDKKARPESTGSDELDSTMDDRASQLGSTKYEDLQSLNLGPPPFNDYKKAHMEPELSPAPQYRSQKQKKFVEPRETYIKADAGDGFIMPKRAEHDGDVWPPPNHERPNLDDGGFGDEEKFAESEKKPRYPRITYNQNDMDKKRPIDRSGPPPPRRGRDDSPRRRPGSPPPPRRRPDSPPPRRGRDDAARYRPSSPPPHHRRPGSPLPPRRRPGSPPPPRRRDDAPPPNHPDRRQSPQGRRPGSPPGTYDENRAYPDKRDEKHRPYPDRYDEKRPYPDRHSEKRPPGPPNGLRQRMQGVVSPYIGKWAQMSRIWTSQTVIMIIFMGVGYMMMANGAKRMAADAAASLVAACGALDTAADNIINAPNHAALSMLGIIEKTAISIIHTTETTLIKIIDIFRDIIVWVLKMYIGTYVCFAELIIRTALAMVTEVSKLFTDALNKALDAVMPTLQNVAANIVGGAQDAINGAIGFFTGGDKSKKVDFSPDDIRKQLDVQIPTDWVNSISSLQDKIPTEDALFGNVTGVLDIPFSFIRNALTGAFAGVSIDLVGSAHLPIDKKADVCNTSMGQEVIIEIGNVAAKIMFIGGLLMIGAAIALIIFNAYMVMRRDRRFRTRITEFRHKLIEYQPPRSVREIENKPATRMEMDMFVLPGEPYLDRFTKVLKKKMGDTERTAAWRWWLHYIWHPPAIACFVAGAVGLASIFFQITAINAMRREFVPKMARELATFQQVVINDKILAPVRGDSVALANSINGDISGVENNINGKVFDPVHSGMASLNDTLNNFVGTYISGIRSVFGGTPLQQPIEGLVNCTLTKNIQAIQKVLGYVNDFASGINLPRVSEDIIYGPVARLVGPLDATANHFREYAIGYYLPNADELDPNSFPEVNVDDILESYENKVHGRASSTTGVAHTGAAPTGAAPTDANGPHSSLLPKSDSISESESDSVSDSLSESESVSESESESSVSSHAPQQRKRQQAGQEATFGILQFPGQQSLSALPAESPEPSHPAPQAPSQAQPAAPAQGTTHVDAQSSKVAPTQSRHESSSDSSFELGGLDDDKSEGSSSFSFEPVPTEDLNRQDIIDAQEFGGYTGGILGKLCDSYVSDLKGDIPLMITLMSVWVVIIIMGTVNVFKDLRRVKKMNLKQ